MFPCCIGNKSSTFGWKIMNQEFIRNFKVHPYSQPNFFGYEPWSNFFPPLSQNPFLLNILISLHSNINSDICPKQGARFRKINNILMHCIWDMCLCNNTVTQYRLYSTRTLIHHLYTAAVRQYRLLSLPLDLLLLLSPFCRNNSRTLSAFKGVRLQTETLSQSGGI